MRLMKMPKIRRVAGWRFRPLSAFGLSGDINGKLPDTSVSSKTHDGRVRFFFNI